MFMIFMKAKDSFLALVGWTGYQGAWTSHRERAAVRRQQKPPEYSGRGVYHLALQLQQAFASALECAGPML
jgi:hypothetical protein